MSSISSCHHQLQHPLSRYSSCSRSLHFSFGVCSQQPVSFKRVAYQYPLLYCVHQGYFFYHFHRFFICRKLCSVQLIICILLHIHIFKASSLLMSAFLMTPVAAPHCCILHIYFLIILFFRFQCTFLHRSSVPCGPVS